jgi:hypothetical protein
MNFGRRLSQLEASASGNGEMNKPPTDEIDDLIDELYGERQRHNAAFAILMMLRHRLELARTFDGPRGFDLTGFEARSVVFQARQAVDRTWYCRMKGEQPEVREQRMVPVLTEQERFLVYERLFAYLSDNEQRTEAREALEALHGLGLLTPEHEERRIRLYLRCVALFERWSEAAGLGNFAPPPHVSPVPDWRPVARWLAVRNAEWLAMGNFDSENVSRVLWFATAREVLHFLADKSMAERDLAFADLNHLESKR